MNGKHHQGSVRCGCWHSSNGRVLLTGGDDRSIRIWRLYPHNSIFNFGDQNNQILTKKKSTKNDSVVESDEDIELKYEDSKSRDSDNDDDPSKLMTDFDPSIQKLIHLLSMPASGEVKAVCMSPHNEQICVALSSRSFNAKSSLDIFDIPHWTWNYSSAQRLSYKAQLRQRLMNANENNKIDENASDDGITGVNDLNPFIENHHKKNYSSDFVEHPSVIPLPYGARERCVTFSPSPNIVFVGLLSCRKKHQKIYCCLMACNIANGASRPCRRVNALLHRKECLYSIKLSVNHDLNKTKKYRLALGTNLGRLFVVTLKGNLSWNNTRKSFITHCTMGYETDQSNPSNSGYNNDYKNNNNDQYANNERGGNTNQANSGDHHGKGAKHNNNDTNANNSPKKKKHNRRTSSKYSVLTARERCFREMADPSYVMITFASMKKYLWNESSGIEEIDIKEFFAFMKPNKRGHISFTQFVQKVDEDGDFMSAFEQFCLTGSSRTDRKRDWMNEDHNSDDNYKTDHDDEIDAVFDGDDDDGSANDWKSFIAKNNAEIQDREAITALEWSKCDKWIISGHYDGEIRFWCKEFYDRKNDKKKGKKEDFYYLLRGAMKKHSEQITCLSLSGTYLVSSSMDGNILIWHLDFLLPSVALPMNITLQTRGVVQLLASINSAHLGDEICDVALSCLSSNMSYCLPNALYLLSCGADENVRCRDVMEVLRQQLTLRILAEAAPQNSNDNDDNNNGGYSHNDPYSHDPVANMYNNDDSDNSDFGATTYN